MLHIANGEQSLISLNKKRQQQLMVFEKVQRRRWREKKRHRENKNALPLLFLSHLPLCAAVHSILPPQIMAQKSLSHFLSTNYFVWKQKLIERIDDEEKKKKPRPKIELWMIYLSVFIGKFKGKTPNETNKKTCLFRSKYVIFILKKRQWYTHMAGIEYKQFCHSNWVSNIGC